MGCTSWWTPVGRGSAATVLALRSGSPSIFLHRCERRTLMGTGGPAFASVGAERRGGPASHPAVGSLVPQPLLWSLRRGSARPEATHQHVFPVTPWLKGG